MFGGTTGAAHELMLEALFLLVCISLGNSVFTSGIRSTKVNSSLMTASHRRYHRSIIWISFFRRCRIGPDMPNGTTDLNRGVDIPPSNWRESRLTCKPTETMVYVGDAKQPIRAEVQDVSRSGFRLVLGQPLNVGSMVKVEFPGMIALGEIRYCLRVGDHFDAGVRIETIEKPGNLPGLLATIRS